MRVGVVVVATMELAEERRMTEGRALGDEVLRERLKVKLPVELYAERGMGVEREESLKKESHEAGGREEREEEGGGGGRRE